MIVLFLAAGARCSTRVRHLPDRPEHPLQPLRLERTRAARPSSSGCDNFRRAFADHLLPRRAAATTSILVVLSLVLQIPFALGLALLLNVKLPRPGHAAHAVLRPVRPVRGRHRRRVAPDPAPRRAARPRPHGVGAEGLIHEWLADPEHRALQPVLRHLVEVLRLPHDPAARRAAADPEGARRGGVDRRRDSAWQRFRYVTLPLLGPTMRVSIFLSIIGALQLFDLVWVTTKGGPIGASSTMATYLYDQFRRSLFGYASAVSIVIFSLSLVDRARSTSASPCGATCRGLVSLAEPHRRRRSSLGAPPGASARRDVGVSTSSRRRARVVVIPLTVLGARRLPHQPAARRASRSVCRTRGSARTTPRSCRRARSGARCGTAP